MPQQHMAMDIFDTIMASLPRNRKCTVSLQGEGEPTLHPQLKTMARQVIDAGHEPYTITNCSCDDPNLIADLFPQVGISLDTLDPDEARRLGRIDLPKVLHNINHLLKKMGPERIILHTVHFGQRIEPIVKLVREAGIGRHVVQPLQVKDDYRKRYPALPFDRTQWRYTLRCQYLQQPIMRFFTVTGRELPCRFLKDAEKFVSKEHTRAAMQQGKLPACCSGCREIMTRKS